MARNTIQPDNHMNRALCGPIRVHELPASTRNSTSTVAGQREHWATASECNDSRASDRHLDKYAASRNSLAPSFILRVIPGYVFSSPSTVLARRSMNSGRHWLSGVTCWSIPCQAVRPTPHLRRGTQVFFYCVDQR
eukprot:scaffold112_cov282-Prasinococcus_capsulatus_cf.AAC.12